MSYAVGSACSTLQSSKFLEKNKGRIFTYEEKMAIVVDIALIAISAVLALLIILSSKGISLGQMSGIGTLGIKSVYVLVAFGGFIIVADIAKLIFKMVFQVKRLAKENENLLLQTSHETYTNLSAESEGLKLQIEFLEKQNGKYLRDKEKAEETCQDLKAKMEALESASEKAANQAKSAAEEAGLITSQRAALSDRALKGVKAELDGVRKENESLKKILEEIRQKLASAQHNAGTQLLAENKELRERLAKVEQESELEENVSKTQSLLKAAQLELRALENQMEEKLNAQLKIEIECFEKIKGLREEETSLLVQVKKARGEWQSWQESASRFRNEAQEHQQTLIELRMAASKQKLELETQTSLLAEVESKLEEAQKKLERQNSTELQMEQFKKEKSQVENELKVAREEARQIQEDIDQLKGMAKAYLKRIEDLRLDSKRKEDAATSYKMQLIKEAEQQIELMISSKIPDEARQKVLRQVRSEAEEIVGAAKLEASQIRQNADEYYKKRERQQEAAQRKLEEQQRAASPRPEQIAVLKEVLDVLSQSNEDVKEKERAARQQRTGRDERLTLPHSGSSSPLSLSPSLSQLSLKTTESTQQFPELSDILRLSIQSQVQSDKLYQPWWVILDFQQYLSDKGIEVSEGIDDLIRQQKNDIQREGALDLSTSFTIIRQTTEEDMDKYFSNLLAYINQSEKGQERRIKRCFQAIYACIMANMDTAPQAQASGRRINIKHLEELADKVN